MDMNNTNMPVDDPTPSSSQIVDSIPVVPQPTTAPDVFRDYPRERGSAAAVDGSTEQVAAPLKTEKPEVQKTKKGNVKNMSASATRTRMHKESKRPA